MKAGSIHSATANARATTARTQSDASVPLTRGLSAQLLVLTVAFVMLAEVLIYVPSVARDRLEFLEDRIAAADIATLALEEAPNNVVSEELARELLELMGVRSIVLREGADNQQPDARQQDAPWPRSREVKSQIK